MIEAKDLRIGNNFQNDEGNILTCFGVAPVDDSDQFNIWYGNELGFILLEEEAKPIPLTEEWLVKFGFDRLDHANEYGEGFVSAHGWCAKYSIDGLRILQPSEKSNWADKQDSFSIIGLNDVNLWVKHVHQLQNLYFALTGEQLTIKE
jgi:hypothetical protein